MTHPHHDKRIKSALQYNLSEKFAEKKLEFDLKKVQKVIRLMN